MEGLSDVRDQSAALKETKVKELFEQGLSKSEIAKKLKIGRTSVIRILANESSISSTQTTENS